MAPTRPSKKAKAKARSQARKSAAAPPRPPRQLLAEATAHLEQGDAPGAAALARQALDGALESDDARACAAYNLLGEIHIELGEVDAARAFFLEAAALDAEGALAEDLGGGPEKFHWLAQLSEEGGADSVRWYEKAAACLRAQIQALTGAAAGARRKGSARGAAPEEDLEASVDERKRKLAETLCAVAEVYMTDLSWEEDAEARCDALVTEATMLAPELPDAWQTVANVRVSQSRPDDAVAALERSLALWADLEPEDPRVPPFPSRVALARLLMECELEGRAVQVCERLVLEDDTSVEAWYLGGLAHFTLGDKIKRAPEGSSKKAGDDGGGGWEKHWVRARQWLSQCQLLFEAQEYEDERLGEHANELLAAITAEAGDLPDEEEEDGDGWEDLEDDSGVDGANDQEMGDS